MIITTAVNKKLLSLGLNRSNFHLWMIGYAMEHMVNQDIFKSSHCKEINSIKKQ